MLANSGTIADAGSVTLGAAAFAGAGGSIEAGGALALTAGTIDLGDGRYAATGAAPLTIAAATDLIANAATIGGNGDVTLSAATLALGGSRVTALGSILLDSGQALTWAVTAWSPPQGPWRSWGNHGRCGGHAYSGGEIYSAGPNFSIAAGSLINRGGAILHAGDGTLAIDIAGEVDNLAGQIATNGTLSLAAAGVKNSGGTITAAAGAVLSSAAAFVNDGGLIASGSNLSNLGGIIEAQGAIDVQAGGYAGKGGNLIAAGPGSGISLTLSGALGGAGLIGSDGQVALAAESITLEANDRITGANVALRTTGGDMVLGGAQVDDGSIALNADTRNIVISAGGLALAADTLALTGGTIDLSNAATQGRTVSQSGFTIYADEAAIRETIALATGDIPNSVILRSAEQLADDPLKLVKDVIGEVQSFSDNLAESGAIEKLVILPIIPPRSNRKAPEYPDYRRYKDRNRIERMFGKLKQQRRIATHYDKSILSFESFLNLAAVRLWLKSFVNAA